MLSPISMIQSPSPTPSTGAPCSAKTLRIMVFIATRSIKALAEVMAKKFHISRSTFATFYLPYILFMIKNKKLELEVEESFGDIIEKEIELL